MVFRMITNVSDISFVVNKTYESMLHEDEDVFCMVGTIELRQFTRTQQLNPFRTEPTRKLKVSDQRIKIYL